MNQLEVKFVNAVDSLFIIGWAWKRFNLVVNGTMGGIIVAEYRHWREMNRTMLKDVVPLDTPYNIEAEISSFCNARCVYCAHSGNHGQYEGNMTGELFQRILDDMKGFTQRVKKFNLFGFGESLCHPDFPEMAKQAKRADVADAIEFTTNGLLITPRKADDILAAGVDTIRISLQGIDADTYWRICRVKIDFEQFVKNLKYLYDHRGKTKIRVKIGDLALNGIKDGEKKFEECFGSIADSIYVEHILPIYQGIDYDSLDESISSEAINGRMHVQQGKINKVCHRAFYRLRIRANGDVTAMCCDATRDVKYGNILDETLPEIWNGPVHNSFLKMQLLGRRFEHPYCKGCMMPNDITNEADLLDPWAKEILTRF